ncbi:MAG: prenyltransferase [Lentisphaerae bacterium]|nr:prenyltransferase [Lentisphaerota bacterium]
MIWVRALRLPFLTASVVPFCVGALWPTSALLGWPFLLGLVAVAATHLSANLVNDYADSRSGADWHDLTYHQGLFGGSKLIQEGRLSEHWYLRAAVLCGLVAAGAGTALAWALGSAVPLLGMAAVLALAWAYSKRPLQLAYRGLGEPVIFLLFGPAVVMGGQYTQTGVLFTLAGFWLSLPFAFLTTAILVANEIADADADRQAQKRTWVQRLGRAGAGRLHGVLVLAAGLALSWCLSVGVVGPAGAIALVGLLPAAVATALLTTGTPGPRRWLLASKLTIAGQALTSLLLLLTVSL